MLTSLHLPIWASSRLVGGELVMQSGELGGLTGGWGWTFQWGRQPIV